MQIADTFSRPDSATLGVAETGGAWRTETITGIVDGVIGVVSSHAEVTTGSANLSASSIDTHSRNHTVQADVLIPELVAAVAHAVAIAVAYRDDMPAAVFVGVGREADGTESVGIIEVSAPAGVVTANIRAVAPFVIPATAVTVVASVSDGVLSTTFDGVQVLPDVDLSPQVSGMRVGVVVFDGAWEATGVEIDNVLAESDPGPTGGACGPWPARLCCDTEGVDAGLLADALQAATDVLWALSGRIYGTCTARGRPCPESCVQGEWIGYEWQPGPVPYNAGHSRWFNLACGSCAGDCSCESICEVQIPGGMVQRVTLVMIDGVILTEGVDYRVDSWGKLVRLGGECWPTCQDMSAADSDVGAWVVEWEYGVPVPTLGEFAVGELACEMVKFCIATGCALPRRTTTVTREGVSFTIMDPFDFFDKHRTGLYNADLFLTTVNPSGLSAPPVVWSPDTPNTWRVAGT